MSSNAKRKRHAASMDFPSFDPPLSCQAGWQEGRTWWGGATMMQPSAETTRPPKCIDIDDSIAQGGVCECKKSPYQQLSSGKFCIEKQFKQIVMEALYSLPFFLFEVPNLKLKRPSWLHQPSAMTVFSFVLLSYFLVTGGLCRLECVRWTRCRLMLILFPNVCRHYLRRDR